MNEKNKEIKDAIRTSGLKFWMVAHKVGITDSTFSRKLRKELPSAKKKEILQAIDLLRKG